VEREGFLKLFCLDTGFAFSISKMEALLAGFKDVEVFIASSVGMLRPDTFMEATRITVG